MTTLGQLILLFVVWVGYGVWLGRRAGTMRGSLRRKTGRQLMRIGMGGFLLGLLILVGGALLIYQLGGMQPGGLLKPWGLVAMALAGIGFVHFQTVGAGAMLLLAMAETRRPPVSSEEKQE